MRRTNTTATMPGAEDLLGIGKVASLQSAGPETHRTALAARWSGQVKIRAHNVNAASLEKKHESQWYGLPHRRRVHSDVGRRK